MMHSKTARLAVMAVCLSLFSGCQINKVEAEAKIAKATKTSKYVQYSFSGSGLVSVGICRVKNISNETLSIQGISTSAHGQQNTWIEVLEPGQSLEQSGYEFIVENSHGMKVELHKDGE